MKLRGFISSVLVMTGVIVISIIGYAATDNILIPDETINFLYWNMKDELDVTVEGYYAPLENFVVTLENDDFSFKLENQTGDFTSTNIILSLEPPETENIPEGAVFKVKIRKKGRLFNAAEYTLIYDTLPPEISIVAQSPDIQRGGTALVVFETDDENPGSAYLSDNFGMEYNAQQFMKPGFFATLYAWYVTETDYSAEIIAVDKAGNASTNDLDLTKTDYEIERAYLTFSPSYVEDKITETGSTADTSGLTASEQYALAATSMSSVQERPYTVWDVTSIAPEGVITNFEIEPFDPIEGAYRTSGFGRLRLYYYLGELMKSSYHTGIDMSYDELDDIVATNPGEVIFAFYNGGYGNTIVLSHGFGLYTLHGHCSELLFEVGDFVEAGETIAISGSTGVATGDHLHFGAYVQGLAVNPGQWMDEDWIQEHINDVLDLAYKIIYLIPDD